MVRARDAWRRVRSAAVFYVTLLALVAGFRIFGNINDTVGLYIAGDLATLVLVIAYAWPIGRDILRLFRAPRMDAVAWALLLFGPLGLCLLNEILVSATHNLPGIFISNPVLELRLAGASSKTVFLLVCVTPPLLEEVAFRGVILEKIRDSFGTRSAVVVVSILFSVLHLALLSFLPFTVFAVILAILRIRTGSLWPAIIGHALFNLTVMLLAASVT